ncbi:MAG TPA: four helix bundle protein [Gemmatimonadales bacterium]
MIAYERFDAWHAAHRLALELYRATDRWPRHEQFGLTIQVRRAALSAPTNIAEGAARRGPREFRRFLDITLGSLAELSYLLRFSRDYGLLTEESWLALETQRDQTGRLTWGLYHAVSKATDKPPSGTESSTA